MIAGDSVKKKKKTCTYQSNGGGVFGENSHIMVREVLRIWTYPRQIIP